MCDANTQAQRTRRFDHIGTQIMLLPLLPLAVQATIYPPMILGKLRRTRSKLAQVLVERALSNSADMVACPAKSELDHWLAIARCSADPRAQLLLQRDKDALLDSRGNLICYADTPNYRIAFRGVMENGHTRPEEAEALLASFIDRAKKSMHYPVFYQAEPELVEQLERIGHDYVAYKLGEEAFIDLSTFSLAGSSFSNLRQNLRKAQNSGLRFEFCPQASVQLLEQCKQLSDQWLAQRSAKEKRFSLGRFDMSSLIHQPLALVYQDEQLLAFANVLLSANQNCLSVDLMRHGTDTPRGTMDLLFAKLFEWGGQQGYLEFSFGMSPLKDVEQDELAHHGQWRKWAGKIAEHGESFYNFRGVRQFKEKWKPIWRPRYLLVPSRRHAMPALLACTIEIAGGHRAVMKSMAQTQLTLPSAKRAITLLNRRTT